MPDLSVNVRHLDGMRFEATTRDVTWRMSDPDEHPELASPMEQLLGAIGGCALVDVVMVLDKRRVDYSTVEAHVEGDRATDFPRRFTSVRLRFESDAPDKELERACRLSIEKYCSVAATVTNATDVSWEHKGA